MDEEELTLEPDETETELEAETETETEVETAVETEAEVETAVETEVEAAAEAEGGTEEGAASMWEMLRGEYDYRELQRGEILSGMVVTVSPQQVVVDVGAKREGIVYSTDLERLPAEALAEIQVGSQVPVYVIRPEGQDGEVVLSINLARSQRDWLRAQELLDSAEIAEVTVAGHNKGGLVVDFGEIQGFVPRSHVVLLGGRNQNLAQMKGQTIPVKVIEVNRRQRRLVMSERAAWREWRRTQKEHLLEKLTVGQAYPGRVTSVTDFGAFVDLGGADGLIHVSELSWDRNVRPKDVVSEGQEVRVFVLAVDHERRRIGLSLKRLQPDPWSLIEISFQPGDLVEGEVTNITKFGAFVRLAEGIEGLVHMSELADGPVTNARALVRPGERYRLKVLSVDPIRRRIGLSLSQVPPGQQLVVPPEPTPTEPGRGEADQLPPEGDIQLAASPSYAEPAESAEPVEEPDLAPAELVEEADLAPAEPDEPAELVEEADLAPAEPDEPAELVEEADPAPAEPDEPAEEADLAPVEPDED